uniref:Uncharacterized protein n=1 Tax=Nothoprocta perdicaria TaxID=30464 RepID=A0A8C6YWY8_NOTPE
MRSSMDWPFSRRFSISMSSFTPSTTICTSSTSEKPRRSALETSNTPPTAAVSTPPGTRDKFSSLTDHCWSWNPFTFFPSFSWEVGTRQSSTSYLLLE